MAAYVRNPRGVIHAVPADKLADHLRQPGMSRATLEDWLAQEGHLHPEAPDQIDIAEAVALEEAPRGLRRKRTKSE